MLAGTEHLLPGGVGHVVQFYDRDDELLETVSDFLLDAIRLDGVAIVVATASHSREFEARLTAAGIDVVAARESGVLLMLDADETLRSFLIAGRPDPEGFEEIFGDRIRHAAAAGRPVRIFG